jgi:molybdopterin synthase sulfur carrier subunit
VQVTILYFASVREAIGLSEERVELAADIVTPMDIVRMLVSRGAGYAAGFSDLSRVRCAVDQSMVALDAPLGQASEIAFFPPVTGG